MNLLDSKIDLVLVLYYPVNNDHTKVKVQITIMQTVKVYSVCNFSYI